MTAPPAQGTYAQPDIHAATRTPTRLDDPAISSHPTPTSTNATTSPAPLTPQRGRLTNRYPDSLGRVPLHRRGTSKTYERLEDLLREAGYKETRVFTPEGDRNIRSSTEKQDGGVGSSVRESVGAVVDFITGLVSRGSSLAHDTTLLRDSSAQSDSQVWLPPSPLVHATHIKDSKVKRVPSRSSIIRNDSSESLRRHCYVDLSADASQRNQTHEVAQHHQSSHELPHHPHSYIKAHHHHRNNHHHQVNNYSSESAFTKPDPPNQPNPRAYLRHMASAPNIQPLVQRSSLSEASLRPYALGREYRKGSRRTFILNDEEIIAKSHQKPRARAIVDENEHQIHPPLPRNWIESVAKALLSGVGGPAAVTSDSASTRTTKSVSTRRSSALSDKSNRGGRGRALAQGTKPPLLCVQVQDAKAGTSQGQVSCMRVMCRSTPTSRANSRVRSRANDDYTVTRSGGKRREGDKSRHHRKGKNRDTGVVPSLARTKVENDDWMGPGQRYSSGWGTGGDVRAYPEGIWTDGDDDDDEEEEEDEEGELGLDRLLVPARRQHSIQSLRKHLQRSSSQFNVRGASGAASPRSGRTSPFLGAPTGRLDWGDTSWSTSRSREWLTSRGDEGEDGYGHVFSGSEVGSSRSGGTKWRRGLPSLAQWTSS